MNHSLEVKIGKMTLKNPVMNASGTFDPENCLIDPNLLGAVVTKSVTLEPRPGNPQPRIAETASGMINWIGLENAGLVRFLAEKIEFLRKLATKIENGEDKWFTCILHPELPMDNNEAERSLRPFVLIRKIIGCIRSNIGMKNYEIMMSLISTWQKQGKNSFYLLQDTL